MSPFQEVSRESYVREEGIAHNHDHASPYHQRTDDEPVSPHFCGQRPNGRLGPVHVSGYVEAFIAAAVPEPISVSEPVVIDPQTGETPYLRLIAA